MNLEIALLDLKSKGLFVWDGFLSPIEVATVTADYQEIYNRGCFKLAGIGNSKTERNTENEIRKDETYWLDPLALSTAQALFWDRLEGLKNAINEDLYLGLWALEGHYSRYPINGHYKKHLDRFNNDDQRTISMVLYLNSSWRSGDGGELRIHPTEAADRPENTLDVAPLGGRLVCFLSSEIPHEVLTANKVRLSFAGWWKRRSA